MTFSSVVTNVTTSHDWVTTAAVTVNVNFLASCQKRACYRPALFGSCEEIYEFVDNFNKSIIRDLEDEGCNCSSLSADNNISNWVCEKYIVEHSWWVQIVYFFMFSLIIMAAIGGNSIVIWIVLAHKSMRTVTNYFLINLALADASISLFNVCFSFTFNLYYDWYFGAIYCVFNNFMAVVPTCASVLTLMSMSLDRYFALVHPLKHHLSKKKTMGVILLIWFIACLCGMPMLLFSYTRTFYLIDGYQNTVCYSDNYPDGDAQNSSLFKAYNYFLLFITYILPLTVLSIAYYKIGLELWGSKQIGEYRYVDNVKAKRKVVKMLIVIVIIFMICWLPYHLYFTIFLKMFTELNISSAIHIYLNMYWLAMASTVCNPFIYCYMNSKFRTGFKYVFRCLPCVRIRKEELLNNALKRSRMDSINNSVTCRRLTLKADENSCILRKTENSINKQTSMANSNSPQISLANSLQDDRSLGEEAEDDINQKLFLLNSLPVITVTMEDNITEQGF